MREIKDADFTDYIFLFGDERSALSDIMARQAISGGGGLAYLMEDGRPAGFMTHLPEADCTRLSYLYVLSERRGRGVGHALFAEAVRRFGGGLTVQVGEAAASFPIVSHWCESFGFSPRPSNVVFRTEEIGDLKNWKKWEEFIGGPGEKLLALLRQQGYVAVSVAHAPEALLDEARMSWQSDYGSSIDIRPFFDSPAKRLDRDMSFFAYSKVSWRLAACSLVTRPDAESAAFEHISPARNVRGTGVILLPFVRSMEAVRAAAPKRAAFTMYEDNPQANAFAAFRGRLPRRRCFNESRFHRLPELDYPDPGELGHQGNRIEGA